jgi:Tol biopolymer transport system component
VVIGSPAWSPGGETLLYAQGSAIWQWKRGGGAEQLYLNAAGLKGMSARWGPSQQVRVATANSPVRELYTLPLRPGGLAPSGGPSAFGIRGHPQFSPDGTKIVYLSAQTGALEVWTANTSGNNPRQLTHLNSAMIGFPRWSADSRRIAFHAWVDSRPQIFTVDAAKKNDLAIQLTNAAFGAVAPTWSTDGKYIYFSRIAGSSRMFRIPARSGPVEDLFEASGGIVTPDGHRIIYFKESQVGLFSRSLDGDPASNPEVKLLDDYKAPGDDLNPFAEGVYYISWNGDARRRAIRFYNYSLKKSVDIFALPGPIGIPQDLAVSPDRLRLIYHQLSRTGADLSVIDFQ